MINGTFTILQIQKVNAQKASSVAKNNNNNNVGVKVGGGNLTFPFFGYDPQKVQIKVGDSVTWTTASKIAEPHTVSFVNDEKLNTGPDVPFMVTNSSKFMPVPSKANSQPTIIPTNNNNNNKNKNNNNNQVVIVGANARTNLANVIDKNGNSIMVNPLKPVVMSGGEKFVNSGIIVAKANQKIFPGSTDSFTVTFNKAGTYDYICIYHPWMVGQVVVK